MKIRFKYMAKYVAFGAVLLALAQGFAGCSKKNPGASGEPERTVSPADWSDPPENTVSPKENVRFTVSGMNAEAAALLKSGKLNEFFYDNEFAYAAELGDFDADGTRDLALVIGDAREWNEQLDAYEGGDDGFLTLRILLSNADGDYRKVAENKAMARTSATLGGLRFSEMYFLNGGLVLNNNQSSGAGLDESFVLGYQERGRRITLDRHIVKREVAGRPLDSFYIEDNADNFGLVAADGFTPDKLESDGTYDLVSRTETNGSHNITERYPDFKIYDKIRERKIVLLIEEDFERGANAVKSMGINADVTIICDKLYQNKDYMSFMFVVSETATGKELFKYSTNIDSRSIIRTSFAERYDKIQLEGILREQESASEAAGAENLYRTLGREIIDAVLSNIDKREAIGAEYSAFSLFSDGAPRIVLSALSGASGFDGSGEELYFGDGPGVTGAVAVYDAAQLVAAITSDAYIRLMPGSYNLSAVPRDVRLHEGVAFVEVSGGKELRVNGVKNLRIEGAGVAVSEIITETGRANAIYFSDCENISIINLKIGYKLVSGSASGAALRLANCSGVTASGLTLSGGTGIGARRSSGISFSDCLIENCTEAILNFDGVSASSFRRTAFKNNRGNDMIIINASSDISFEHCDIKNNSSSGGIYSFFNIASSSRVSFDNSSLIDNYGLQPQARLSGVKFTSMDARGNSFLFDFPYVADNISQDDLALGIVSAGITRERLEELLAAPWSKRASFDETDPFAYDEVYHYASLDAGIYGGAVYALKTTDTHMATVRGIKLGDTVEAVYQKYGYVDMNGDVLAYPYSDPDGKYSKTLRLYFKFANGKVSEMGVKP